MTEARVFFALWPEAGLTAALHQQAETLAQTWGGRPSRPESMHLTLAFLGSVPVARLDDLMALGAGIRASPFNLALDTLGRWPGPRVAWAAPSQVPEALIRLQTALAEGARRLGLPPVGAAGQGFRPHVTLVRKVINLPAYSAPMSCLSWDCAAFHLVRSRLSSTGSHYESLARWPLMDPGTP